MKSFFEEKKKLQFCFKILFNFVSRNVSQVLFLSHSCVEARTLLGGSFGISNWRVRVRVRVCVFVFVCVFVCVRVFVCVCERERERGLEIKI